MGMGGRHGNGRQYVSWVHELDVARSTEWFADNPELQGIFNCTAPYAIKNADLMRVIRKTYGIPFGLPAPKWLLDVGAIVIGTEPELILKSRWVMPKRLQDSGFEFLFERAGVAVRDILGIH
jgi:hypothetical protein